MVLFFIISNTFILIIKENFLQNHDFLNHARLEFAIWFSKTYNKLFDKNLGDIEIIHIKGVLGNEMEVFK
jgi:hypothetical protein